MEPIPADTLPPVLAGDGVGRSLGRHGLVEDGVEACIMPRLGKPAHHVADQGDRLGIVQGRKRHGRLQVAQHLLGDSLMLVEQRTGMHHPVANRIDRRHARPTYRILQQGHRILLGCIVGRRSSTAQLPPFGIAESEAETGSADATDLAGKQRARPGGGPVPICAGGRLENGKFDGR